jgi:hypothetical protein
MQGVAAVRASAGIGGCVTDASSAAAQASASTGGCVTNASSAQRKDIYVQKQVREKVFWSVSVVARHCASNTILNEFEIEERKGEESNKGIWDLREKRHKRR